MQIPYQRCGGLVPTVARLVAPQKRPCACGPVEGNRRRLPWCPSEHRCLWWSHRQLSRTRRECPARSPGKCVASITLHGAAEPNAPGGWPCSSLIRCVTPQATCGPIRTRGSGGCGFARSGPAADVERTRSSGGACGHRDEVACPPGLEERPGTLHGRGEQLAAIGERGAGAPPPG